ncbi:hypothetical protein [Phenylobacterium sp.]|uniref:hypothetical protein n=1 Tax=Phenylobacterium sp. TaxID=1871053 RepID=UPI003566A2A2
MKVVIALILALGLTACETTANDGGTADYDALARASNDCKAHGGTLVLKDGGDAQYIQDYACKGK